ncbi:Patatin OS=Tsukamurella paurometabola (strain ATCC 8368 / DSM / CCUG 35730 / CIP 100753 / JCM 10117 / KCTC 9821 / NBRC 16120 / NCIMB 702349 / NCTC 13040)OX=521096 GN=Tpau_0044 PE=4 SV=1 [Tsukamurella paurometabola]|uniref:Patatin n=1 Tax=Tsukamurella paurometabola (strain ATCC 8368 / DSM 20162 / CCUG 35730 / CIP 100753 / JCM 10117 / KCTC 9821 / NBRC 16120 / NCIMB 702349 / NCTC 13040) TaxID=521096 RepID=D5UPT0_TSUPD|nr:patatin-like phospholipase family protein [Tsukamurella paurometabola]ADG76698.1 Patatin [Tsukamurella paurometabola DSM 20162]SUP41266.1 Patatin-like phospholipase [Tsukamurella paurometabola]
MSRALVIGCGGTIGGAWTMAALAALADQLDWDPREAAVLQGTSAGAEIVTLLSGGYSPHELVSMQEERSADPVLTRHLAATPGSLPRIPISLPSQPSTLWSRTGGHAPLTGVAPRGRGDARWLQELADSVLGVSAPVPERARLVAYEPATGERVAFGAAGAPSATAGEALRASWAIPAWMPPVTISGRTFVDGGAASTASLDLIAPDDADEIYAIVSMASAPGVRGPGIGGLMEQALLRRPMSSVFWREVAVARARGQKVTVIAPDAADLAGLGANFMARGKRAAAFAAAQRTAPQTVRRALSGEAVPR